MKEQYQSIIGKEFVGFKFSSDRQLNYQSEHTLCEGYEGKVLSLHSSFPKFALARMKDKNGDVRDIHYPSALVKAQIEEREYQEKSDAMSVDDLLNEMKQLTSRI